MITKEQFLLRQPSAPEVTPTDEYYFKLSNHLIQLAEKEKIFPSYPRQVVERAALCLVGYYQDVISDAGIWRSFINECRRLFNRPVPFYEADDDYIDYELNRADVQFMVWYALSMNYENRRVCYPLDSELLEGAEVWYAELSRVYDEAPIPQDYRLARELTMHDEEDRQTIFRLGNWLFLHCYLMTPAYALTLAELSSEYNLATDEGVIELQKRIEISMSQDPTGPLALYLYEWLYLIVENRKAPEPKQPEDAAGVHKYYSAFTKATNGKEFQFFATYREMNDFFISALGWASGEDHLPQVKNDSDFVLMVDPKKGMLLARNVARCIASADNPLYDRTYAREHAMDLLTVRGQCPPDLLEAIGRNGWLPDATFPGNEDHAIVSDNFFFIARCYLQGYYRGD